MGGIPLLNALTQQRQLERGHVPRIFVRPDVGYDFHVATDSLSIGVLLQAIMPCKGGRLTGGCTASGGPVRNSTKGPTLDPMVTKKLFSY
jgi:hypothetical protein